MSSLTDFLLGYEFINTNSTLKRTILIEWSTNSLKNRVENQGQGENSLE